MNITLGFSPCPNDTFMFAAMVNHWIDTKGLTFEVHMDDVEQLNVFAGSGTLDVTKMSFSRAFSVIDQYSLLNSGAALGNGCGPVLISKRKLSREEVIKGPIALPGKWTTANLLFDIFYPECDFKQYHLFSEIENLVLNGEVAAGVIIHENRFTYKSKGLIEIEDLGEAWEKMTGHPIPLGGIFAHNRIPALVHSQISGLLRNSIIYAYDHPEQVMAYVRNYSQEMDEEVMKSHIALYVNDFSLALGEKGSEAVAALKKYHP